LYDLSVGDRVVPGMGGAELSLWHGAGTRTRIVSDLTSPVRERRIMLRFENGAATGHYPCGADDDYARLSVRSRDGEHTEVFPDDALSAFVSQSYQRFQRDDVDKVLADDFARNCRVVELLDDAKSRCAR
jgi:hypothetical protein